MPPQGQLGDGGADMVNALGAVNALRTGNVVLDMIIAMCIPVIFKSLFDFMGRIKENFQRGDWRLDMLLFWRKMIERTIDHKTTSNLFGDTITDRDTRNNVLLKAIELFLHHKKIRWERSRVSLTSMTQNNRPWWWGDDDGDERSPAGKLKKYQLSQKAPNYVWQPLGVYGDKPIQVAASSSSSNQTTPMLAIEDVKPDVVELRVEEDEQDKGEKGEKTINTVRYRFRSHSAHAIDSFIGEAYQWYLEELKKEDDNSRYLYEMQLKGGGAGETAVRSYKRYKLSDDKTFDSLFFEEKQNLLALLKHFTNKTGKYGVKGYPHKLGLLLHGPPGTGKTSLIKVMAQHLQRSIVNVPLARISTNQELMDMMFDQQYMVEGEEVPIKLGFKDVIFSMEDVDAASKVVQRRDGKTTASVTQTEVVEAPLPKTGWEILLESNDEECRSLVKLLIEKSPKLKAAALESKTVCNLAKQLVAPPGLGLLLSTGSSSGENDDKPREEAKTKVEQLCEQREIAQKYIKEFASSIKALIDAGTVPDDKLADELLGLGSVGKLSPYLKKSSAGYGTGEEVKQSTDDDEEEDTGTGGGVDMNLIMGTLASVMSSNSGKGGPGSDMMGATSAFGLSSDSKKDKLNLSGLLNVLDGVVDTPERVLIMTTNHPEMLDPALIRPGRIDKKILLAFMSEVHAASMIEYYFQTEMSAKQRDRLHCAIVGSDEKGTPAMNITPAQIEQFCAEFDDLDNLIVNLESKTQPHKVSRLLSSTLSTDPKAGAGPGPGGRPVLTRGTSKTISFDH